MYITGDQKRFETFVKGQNMVLRMIREGKSLPAVLDSLSKWIENQSPDNILASILLTDESGQKLLHGAAPSLPDVYNQAIHGINIGPKVGSCGTAAYTKTRVIVDDISTDPLWKDFKELALSHNLRACWSSPLINQQGKVRGTFAVYYNEPRKPAEHDLYLISLFSEIALLAIESDIAQNERERIAKREKAIYLELEKSEQNFRNLVMQAPVGICIVKGKDVLVETVNENFLQLVGKQRSEFENRGYWDTLKEAEPYYGPVLNQVLNTGVGYVGQEAEVTLVKNGIPGQYFVSFVYEPILEADGAVERVMILGIDVTPQVVSRKRIEQSEQEVRSLVESAPFPIGVYIGKEKRIVLANQAMVEVWNKGTDVIGKLYTEILPELENQEIFQQIDDVYSTGKAFHAQNQRVELMVNGKLQTYYFNYSFTPLSDSSGSVYGVMNTGADVTDLNRAMKKIEEGNQLLYNFFKQVPATLCILKGPEHVYEFANDGYMQLIGWKKDIIGKPVREVLPELNDQPFFDLLDNVYASGESFVGKEMPVELEMPDGTKQLSYQNFIFQAFNDMKGETEGILVFAYDVTAMVMARKKVEESEYLFRSFSNNINSLAWMATADGWIYWYNERWYDYTGSNYEEMQGWGWGKVHHPDHLQRIVDYVKVAWHQDQAFELTFPLKGKDGNYRWFLTRVVPIKDEKGKLIRWIGTNTDIHEQVLAEDRFRTLAETLPQLVWIADKKGIFEYTSPQWINYTGIKDIVAIGVKTIIHPDDRNLMLDAWLQNTSHDIYRVELRLKNKEGEYRWHFCQAEPIRDDKNHVIKWIGAFTDIHDQKTASERLEQLVKERTIELQRSNEDLQQFAHVASHDLKEPLRKIKIFTGRLLDDPDSRLSEKGHTFLTKMSSATDRLFAMVEGVLTYSTINASEQKKETVNLNKIILQIKSDLELLIDQKHAVIKYENLPVIEGGEVLIYQLFYNLINNSLKFSSEERKPVIMISGFLFETDKRKDPMVRIELRDNGIGFDPEKTSRIFETFARLNSKDKYEGTGLGLSLCKKIVERHGGSITAVGVPGEGSLFTLYLPLTHAKKNI